MRRFLIWVLALLFIRAIPAIAGEAAVKDFSGGGTTTTALFHVHDRWEVRWSARRVVSIAVMAANGTIVAGGAGVLRGSLFVPTGGDYYLRISDDSSSAPAGTKPQESAGDSAESAISWHLQIFELGPSVASSQTLSVYSPYFAVPDSAILILPKPAPPPPPKLTDDQARTVVTIKGDSAQGAGFLVRTPHGLFVLTHLQLLAANPNVQILSSTGAPITVLALKGGVNRDLALFTVKDDHLPALPLPTDDAVTLATNDLMLIPSLDGQGGVMMGRPVKIISVSPDRIDLNPAMDAASNGSPVIQITSGNAVAMVTAEKRVDFSTNVAQAWPANPAPGSANIIPSYGLLLTGVTWENYEPGRFLAETQFLQQFHETTRCLDSYLNGRNPKKKAPDDNAPDNRYYQGNAKLREAQGTYGQFAGGADQGQHLEAAAELLNSLQTVADTDLDTLDGMTGNLYAYDQKWAREEMAYRKAIKKQLDDLSYSLGKVDAIARSR